MNPLEISYQLMTEADIPAVTPVMKRAFDDDVQKHQGKECGGPPGYDNGEFFRTWLLPLLKKDPGIIPLEKEK